MSWNANTQYKAVDLDQLASECKQAITSIAADVNQEHRWWGEDLHQWPIPSQLSKGPRRGSKGP